jgi:succinate dehydrogenase / fumarate reductase flavoprotein subunit
MPIVGSPANQATNIRGLYAAGEVDHQYHGANRLGANSLLSCIYGGMLAGPAVISYSTDLDELASELPSTLFEQEERRWTERFEQIGRMDGTENAYEIHYELGRWMVENVTIVRDNAKLRETENKILELRERWHRLNVLDTQMWANQAVAFANQLWNMLELARLITVAAEARNESRGAHYKPEFPERDDENWLKTTIAEYSPDGPKLSYEPVDTSLIRPVARKYD